MLPAPFNPRSHHSGRLLRALAGGLFLAVLLAGPVRAVDPGAAPGPGARARAWLSDHAAALRQTARLFQVDPVVAGTVIAAELDRRTMLDDLEEDYVRGLLRDKDDRFFARLAAAFTAPPEQDPEVGSLDRMLYITSLGPAQLQVRLAMEVEPRVAAARKARPRALRPLLQAILDDEGCIDTVCVVLHRAADAYRREAGLEIGSDAGAMATAYNQGSPVTRARQLKKNGGDAVAFKKNEMGRYADALAPRVRAILEKSKPPER
jgi:hypothetical protein